MSPSSGFLRYVNPLQGTDSHHGFSKGNTLPLTAMPFGMNHWSAQTEEGSWFFNPRARKLQGIRCTHQPSPWIGDYGAFVVMPQVGARRLTEARARASAYRPDRAVFKPHHFRAELITSGTILELTPTERGAVFRFDFPVGEPARVILDPVKGESSAVLRDSRTIAGFTRGAAGGVPEGFAHYFVACFDRDIVEAVHFRQGQTVEEDTGERVGLVVEFGNEGGPVTMKVATSFISIDQAFLNLAREIGDATFDEILSRAEQTWEENLGRIEIGADEDERNLRTFYSCLYRTQLFPRIWHELDAEGVPHHRSPYDGQVHPGVLYTDNGFWDTYRTEYPLLALLSPGRLAEILQGWVNAYKEGGWFPQWASPGYRACMVGTHIDAVMADGVSRGIRDFDVETALEGMLKHAFEPGKADGSYGRIGIEDYKELGYVSVDSLESVARSLDYAYDDYCIAQVAESLGREASELRTRQTNYRNSFDPSVGFMRGRHADGSWEEPWSEFRWGSPYVEGGPWQSLWAVPHDVTGLAELLGGAEAMVAKLDQMLATPPKFEVGIYGFEIHEMTEMACADFGQYAHSNQPVHHALYLYSALGRPERTQVEARRVMAELYSPDDFPGDEDNGEMAAWYVLSALGTYPACPGDGTWTLGSPLFRRVAVKLENGRELVVEAPANSAEAVLVEGVSFNGDRCSVTVAHAQIAAGGTLRLQMRQP